MKLFALVAASAAVLCAQTQLPIANLPPETVVAKTAEGKSITAGEIRGLLEVGDPTTINMVKNSPQMFLGSVFFARFMAEEAEKQHLAEQSPLKEQLAYLRDRFLAGAMVNQIRESYAVPDQAITDYYAHNQNRFEMARIKVIVIGFCPTVPTTGDIAEAARLAQEASGCKSKRTEQQAHDIATGIVGQIRGGADFVKLVAKYSEDPDSKATEGDFGLVTRDNSFKPEIKAAVFALTEADVSDPIRSGTYFYIIKLKGKKEVQPLESVREPIIQELKQKHFTDWLDDVNKRFKPEILRPDFFTAAPKP